MGFWIREIAGWLLVGLGLYVFLVCYAFLVQNPPWIIEAGILTVIGFVVFRGGIHLLKIAIAARICLHTQRGLAEQAAGRQSRRQIAAAENAQ